MNKYKTTAEDHWTLEECFVSLFWQLLQVKPLMLISMCRLFSNYSPIITMQNCINFKLFQNQSWEKSRKSCKINCWQRQLRILWSSACTVGFGHSAAGSLHSWHKNVFVKTRNVFVQIAECICQNGKMYLIVLLAGFGLDNRLPALSTLKTPNARFGDLSNFTYYGWAATFCLPNMNRVIRRCQSRFVSIDSWESGSILKIGSGKDLFDNYHHDHWSLIMHISQQIICREMLLESCCF